MRGSAVARVSDFAGSDRDGVTDVAMGVIAAVTVAVLIGPA
jgi:hypothetical protein